MIAISKLSQRAAGLVLLLLAGGLFGCDTDTANRTIRQPVVGAELLGVHMLESCPVQIRVDARVFLGACDTLLTPRVRREGNTFTIALEVESKDSPCILLIEERPIVISLGDEFTFGEYRVVIEHGNQGTPLTFTHPGPCAGR